MEQPISMQVIKAAATLLCGVALGLVYNGLRVLRYSSGKVLAILWDAVFCLLCGGALFVLGLGPGGGELRLYMFPLCLAGALLSSWLFGAWVRAGTRFAKRKSLEMISLLLLPWKKYGKKLKKLGKILKKPFSCVRKWFTIIYHLGIRHRENFGELPGASARETGYEAEKIQHLYPDRHSCSDGLCHGQHHEHPRKN